MTRHLMLRIATLALLAGTMLAPGTASAAEIPCADHADPRLASMSDAGIGFTSVIEDQNGRPLGPGRYALPATQAPTQLVVMFHGHGNDSCSWRRHLTDVAAKGAVAVAMDYPGHLLPPDQNGVRATYGWFVKEGARDSIQAAKYFMNTYPSITKVFAFGISMGGNASGLAVASPDAKRVDGVTPLFDYWVDVEGVNNLIEEYLVASAVAPVNAGAQLAVDEIEEENGGSLLDVPEEYLATTNVARAADMAGLKGAVVVNGLDDGLVPTDQTPQMTVALTLAGVPTLNVTVLLRGSGESGTTGSGIVGGPLFEAAGQDPYESPLAGHGWEGSDTHLVIKTGFEKLYALMAGGTVEGGEEIIPGA
jgi:serine aminopeptidase S33 family